MSKRLKKIYLKARKEERKACVEEIDKIKNNLITNEDFTYRSARTFIDMLEELKKRLGSGEEVEGKND